MAEVNQSYKNIAEFTEWYKNIADSTKWYQNTAGFFEGRERNGLHPQCQYMVSSESMTVNSGRNNLPQIKTVAVMQGHILMLGKSSQGWIVISGFIRVFFPRAKKILYGLPGFVSHPVRGYHKITFLICK